MRFRVKTSSVAGVLLVFSIATLPACSCNGEDAGASGGDGGGASGPGISSSQGSGGGSSSSGMVVGQGGGFGQGTGSGGAGGEPECAASEDTATFVNKPVDVIFVIDNSLSMSAEIEEVEEQISANFASIIAAADPPIDYRVIMVSRHGSSDSQRICVSAPLSGTPDADMDGHCDTIPTEPQNTDIFYHHSVRITSHNALCQLNRQFSRADQFELQPEGYQAVLRPEAFKNFVVITDDRVDNDQQDTCNSPLYDDLATIAGGEAVAAEWDADMLALSPEQFGTPEARNYVFHSIIGLAPFDANDLALPHPPTAPIITQRCSPGSENAGTGYQALSILTGGLRYPSCGLDYTTIFRRIAEGIIEGAKVACEFEIPEPPPGETLDLSTVVVVYTPGDGTPARQFQQVADVSQCTAESFYIANDAIFLCPDACATVQRDDGAGIKVRYGCNPNGPR